MPERLLPRLDYERIREGGTSGRVRVALAAALIGAAIIVAAVLLWGQKDWRSLMPALIAAPTEFSRTLTTR